MKNKMKPGGPEVQKHQLFISSFSKAPFTNSQTISNIMKSLIYVPLLLAASVSGQTPGCTGHLSDLIATFPTTGSLNNLYIKWLRPVAVQMGEFGPYTCNIAPISLSYYINRTITTIPMLEFSNFDYRPGENGTAPITESDQLKWHISTGKHILDSANEFKNTTVTNLQFEVLDHGQV
jgi:hypothetical protein